MGNPTKLSKNGSVIKVQVPAAPSGSHAPLFLCNKVDDTVPTPPSHIR